MSFKKPEASQLVQMLDMILGISTKAAKSDSFDSSAISHTAIYVDDAGEKVASCVCTLPTAASLGCALSMIQPGSAESMVEDKELSQTATDNLYEVMNIFSSLLMDDKTSHLKLGEVVAANDPSVQNEDWESFGFTVQMGKYGEGHLLFKMAPAS